MTLKILAVGVEDQTVELIASSFLDVEIENMKNSESFFNFIESSDKYPYAFIVCTALPDVPAFELAQAFKMGPQTLPIIYVSREGQYEKYGDLEKNGFDKIFYLPMDRYLLQRFCRQIEKAISGVSQCVYTSVPIVDLEKDVKVEFDVFIHLPINAKYVKIVKAGHDIREDQIKKIKTFGVKSLFVDENDFERFCEYAASKIKELLTSEEEPLFIKKQKLETAARHMFVDLLSPAEASFDDGKEKLASTHKIVENFIGSEIKDIQSKVLDILAEGGMSIYSHSLRVSSIAALFSLALSRGKPEELAIAGLFHDIGLVKVPERLWFQEFSHMSEEDRALLAQHPAISIAILTDKKMVLIPTIQEAILQHHERPDGKGYPRSLSGHKVSESAQILALADRLEELTSERHGSDRLSPWQALEKIQKENLVENDLINSVKPFFDPEGQPG